MTTAILADVLLHCVLINYAILLVWFVAFSLAHERLFALHTRWFALSKADFDRLHYQAMAIFKILVLVFNLTPWLALHLMSGA